jgi:hypothetical protein
VPEELDYHCLKRSLEFLFEQHVPAQLVTAESHPVRLVEWAEQRSITEAQQFLLVALEDLVEATRGFSIEHVLAADSELERRDACTLSVLRSLFPLCRNQA